MKSGISHPFPAQALLGAADRGRRGPAPRRRRAPQREPRQRRRDAQAQDAAQAQVPLRPRRIDEPRRRAASGGEGGNGDAGSIAPTPSSRAAEIARANRSFTRPARGRRGASARAGTRTRAPAGITPLLGSDGASTKWEVEKKGLPHGVAATAALLDKTLTVLAKIPFAGTLVPSVSLPVDLSSKPKFSLKQSFSL